MSGKMHGDLIIETEAGRYIIELLASGEPEDVRDHFKQLDTYARAMRAKEAWLVHFTVGTGEQPGLPADSLEDPRPYQLHALHVQHDLQFAKAALRVDSERGRECVKDVSLGSGNAGRRRVPRS
jgi:hypothetical protein